MATTAQAILGPTKLLTAAHVQGPLNPARDTEEIPRGGVAALAYTLWEKRGCPDGSPEIDWYAAEQLLKQPSPTQIGKILDGQNHES